MNGFVQVSELYFCHIQSKDKDVVSISCREKNNNPDLFSIIVVRKRAMVGIGTTDF